MVKPERLKRKKIEREWEERDMLSKKDKEKG